MTLPDGVVTFLFTDVEGSTRLWEDAPDGMMRALEQHDAVIDAAVDAHNGTSVKPRGEGDSRFIVFPVASDAVAAVAEMQAGLANTDWVTPRPVKVRMSLHTGHADLQMGDYYGSAVNRAARLRAIAHGGQTVMSEATWQLVQEHLPDGVTVIDMGRHGLKDLTRPEHVYQVNVAGLAVEFPPLKSLDAVPNNLPEQLTELIGRESELEEVGRLLGQTRLVTILAPGGTGKTRLAIQAAADHTAGFTDGVFFMSLADLSVGGDIIPTVAAALGISLAADRDPKQQLLDYLSPRAAMLLFDNFEHLSDSAGIVTEILEAAPQVTVIVTSRTQLHLPGETTMALGGLDTSWETPAGALQTAGVQLFVDAARRAHPGFDLTADDVKPLAEIMELTGGMPLAILLAAAWTNTLTVAEIATEIRNSLDFLESLGEQETDRHRSIRAVFDYTWELLTESERQVFAALSVFRGGFTREAAAAIADAGVRDLAKLIANSLLTRDLDSGRYRVHELLRQYAQEELDADSVRSSAVADAHAHYYAEASAQAFKPLFAEEVATLESMEADFDNIRVAWRHSVAVNDATSLIAMLGVLSFVVEIRCWYGIGADLFGEAVDSLDAASEDRTTAIARAGSAVMHGACSALLGRQPEEAADRALRAVAELRGLGDPVMLLVGLTNLYVCLLYVGRLDDVFAVSAEIQEIGRSVSPSDWPSLPLYLAGEVGPRAMLALLRGDLDTAEELLEHGRQVLEPSGELYYFSWNLAHRARLALAQGRPEDAFALLDASTDCSRQVGSFRAMNYSRVFLGDALLAEGLMDRAEQAYLEGLAAAEKTGMVPQMLGALRRIAAVYAATDRTAEAVEILSSVLAEPDSARQMFTDPAPNAELAAAQLDEIAGLDPEELDRAKAEGSSRSYGVVVKELVDAWKGKA